MKLKTKVLTKVYRKPSLWIKAKGNYAYYASMYNNLSNHILTFEKTLTAKKKLTTKIFKYIKNTVNPKTLLN